MEEAYQAEEEEYIKWIFSLFFFCLLEINYK